MNKKYKLVEKKFFPEINRELWQIEALCEFGNVKKGEKGGWIERESNLDNDVYGNACVYENARIYENAKVCGDAEVYGDAWVYGDAKVYGNAEILVLGKLGYSRRFITATWSKDNCLKVKAGCFFGTIDDFQKAVIEKYGDGESDYMLIIPLLRKKEKEWGKAQQERNENEQKI